MSDPAGTVSIVDHNVQLTQLKRDSAALSAVVTTADLTTAVPSCPGWSLSDLAYHVAAVYQHKIAAMRTGRRPDPWPPEPLEGWRLAPVPEFLAQSSHELLAELSARDPAQACWTWYAEDQTVGFWARRMAQETAIHRWDAERTVGSAAPIDARVAADGIDELLVAFLSGDWSDDPQPGPAGFIDVVGAADRWRVGLRPDVVTVLRSPAGSASSNPPDATISGSDEELLLALWGRRRPLPAAVGDRSLVDGLRNRLALVSQ